MKTVYIVVGNRPQYIKAAIFLNSLKKKHIKYKLIDTNQHYDKNLSNNFFKELKIPKPVINLKIGSHLNSLAVSKIIEKLQINIKTKPDGILVFGDTNSTLAASLYGALNYIPVFHSEGGERLYRRNQLPEEINRCTADSLSSLIFTSSLKAKNNLIMEGIHQKKIIFTGDVIFDLYKKSKKIIIKKELFYLKKYNLKKNKYIFCTIHREENTNKVKFKDFFNTLKKTNKKFIISLHPRLKKILNKDYFKSKNIKFIDPSGYLETQCLIKGASKIISDSGGITRESFFSKKFFIVLLKHTWWSEAANLGWSVNCKIDNLKKLKSLILLNNKPKYHDTSEFGNGRSSILIDKGINFYFKKTKQSEIWNKITSYNLIPENTERKFSYSYYQDVIKLFREKNYRFIFFDDKNYNKNHNKIILRHDVNFDLNKALNLAKIEKSINIKSTYFFLLSNKNYNIFNHSNLKIIKKIESLGHKIGLHFDFDNYPNSTNDETLTFLKNEIKCINFLLNTKIKYLSIHRPSMFFLKNFKNKKKIFGLVNTYYKGFTTGKFKYLSDSNGSWREGDPISFFNNNKIKLSYQILTHPFWWNKYPKNQFEILKDFLVDKENEIVNNSKNNCKFFKKIL